MQDKRKIAQVFVDEYGDPNLATEKQGTTPFFVYVAVVIFEENLADARKLHQDIINKYFKQRGYIKSNKISSDDRGYNLQINIINELQKIKHFIVCIIVDKSEVEKNGGLFYKKTFIKFFQRLLSKELCGKYDEIHIIMDNIGRPKFKASLKEYMARIGFRTDLFSSNTFEYKNDISEEPLIQWADFYAGCLGRYLSNTYKKKQSDYMYNLIKTYTFIRWFPFVRTNYLGARLNDNAFFNQEIYNISIESAKKFLENTSDDTGREIVSIFLQESYSNPMRYISSGEIQTKMQQIGINVRDPISTINELRNKGFFLVTPRGKKGYKFPCNDNEIAEYFYRITNNVIPQLERANVLHRILIEQSQSDVNILKREEFKVLSNLITTAININLIK